MCRTKWKEFTDAIATAQEYNIMSGKLYVVGTPIGNLGDLSPRAVEVLSQADFIAAEDTRVTLKLLNHFGIKNELVSHYEHSDNKKIDYIVTRIAKGDTCAVVSDAGMPCISDPGEDLVRKVRELGIEVESVPGPSAVITALAVSGMPSGRFCFEGFLSVEKDKRSEHLFSLKNEKRTMIFYEAPHKLLSTLSDMLDYFGDREICLVKELTKIHETVIRTSLSDAIERYKSETPRGEYVIIVSGSKDTYHTTYTLEDAVQLAKEMVQNGASTLTAAKTTAVKTGFKKNDIYKLIV